MISHGEIHGSSQIGVNIRDNRRHTTYGLSGTKPYFHLSNLNVHNNGQQGIRVEYNYEVEIKMDSLIVINNNNTVVDQS